MLFNLLLFLGQVSISGYNDKQKVLLEKILEKMLDFKVSQDTFNRVKEQLVLEFENWNFEAPREHATFFVTCALQEIVWTAKEKLECLRGTSSS